MDNNIPMINGSGESFNEDPEAFLEAAFKMTQGSSAYRNDRKRPYDGQPWTDNGIRGQQLVTGLTMRDIRDCLIKAMLLSAPYPEEYFTNWSEYHNSPDENTCIPSQKLIDEQDKFPQVKVELGTWTIDDVYKLDFNNIDPIAVTQNLSCEIEKMMGIYPNISMCETDEDTIKSLLNISNMPKGPMLGD